MRTILTYSTVLYCGVLIAAQEFQNVDVSIKRTVMTFDDHLNLKKSHPKKGSTARLYLFKNSRIKKALAFRTKANKAKLA